MRILVPLLLSIFSLLISNVNAERINKNDAAHVANNWFLKIQPTILKTTLNFTPQNCFEIKENEEPILYIFNGKINGFVIVAGDNLSVPIIGYSIESDYNPNNSPTALRVLLASYKKQILEARIQGKLTDRNTQSVWNELLLPTEKFQSEFLLKSQKNQQEMQPLLKTKWNQVWPYNRLCPTDPSGPGGHTVTGCVATALAQIMKYYNYPATGFGDYGYSSQYGWLSANFGQSIYDWNNMPDTLTNNSSALEQNEIAKLMYHCGVIVEMNYGTDGSAASLSGLPFSLFNHFDYSVPTLINHQMYSLDQFTTILKDELDNNRPVYYAAGSTANGERHALVCDGYQGGDYFHFNFGWGGMADGYGLLNDSTYYWRVTALSNAGYYSDTSSTFSFTTINQSIVTLLIKQNWNIISVPVVKPDMTKSALFSTAASSAFTFNNGYTVSDTLFNGKGYWLKFSNDQSLQMAGMPVTDTTIKIVSGWNIIGGYDKQILVKNITSNPSGIINSSFFGYNNGYIIPDTLQPGQGYWLKASQVGVLNINSALAKGRANEIASINPISKDWGKIIISDAQSKGCSLYLGKEVGDVNTYGLPPKPPAGVLDVRFVSNVTAGIFYPVLPV